MGNASVDLLLICHVVGVVGIGRAFGPSCGKPTQMGTPKHNDHPSRWAPPRLLTMSTTSSQTQLVGDLHECNYYILCRHRPGRKLIRETGTIVSHNSSPASIPRNGEFLPD